MKTVVVTTEWRARQYIEVPDDTPDELMEWPDELLDQVSAAGAELVDWEVR